MGNWYRVTKKIHGRFYDYWQRTYRVGKQVKTENKYIGPTGGPALSGRSTRPDIAAWYSPEHQRKLHYEIIQKVVKKEFRGPKYEAVKRAFPAAKTNNRYARMTKDYVIYATDKDFVVMVANKPSHFPTASDAAQFVEKITTAFGYTITAEQAFSQMQPMTVEEAEKKATAIYEQTKVKEVRDATLCSVCGGAGHSASAHDFRPASVSSTAPYRPEDALRQLDPLYDPEVTPAQRRKYEKDRQKEILDWEEVKYGSVKSRKKRQAAKGRRSQKEKPRYGCRESFPRPSNPT